MSKTGITLELVGHDGNAFAILGQAQKALRRAKKLDLWPEIRTKAMSGDYDNLLRVMMEYFDVEQSP